MYSELFGSSGFIFTTQATALEVIIGVFVLGTLQTQLAFIGGYCGF